MSNNMTWHCQLIISNDPDCNCEIECITSHVMNKIYHDRHGRAYENQTGARIYILSQFVRCYIEEQIDADNEHGFNNPVTQEIICGALQEIDFREIAESLIGDYHQKSPAEVAESEEFFEIMGFGNYDIDED